MSRDEIHLGRASRFSQDCRRRKLTHCLTDVDGWRPGNVFDSPPLLLEHRTGNFRGAIGDGSMGAVERLARSMGYEFSVVSRFNPCDADLRQRVWLVYDRRFTIAVFAVVGNTWPDEAISPTWDGPARLHEAWPEVRAAAASAGIQTRILTVDATGAPVGDDRLWLEHL